MIDQDATLIGYVVAAADTAAIRHAIGRADRDAAVEISPCVSDDWVVRWREGVRAHDVGALRIVPPWLSGGGDESRTVVIDPGMAFGTGEHASTRGVLRLLSTLPHFGDLTADLGTGSGILAIAAAKLGARRVAAIEIDPDAIPNAEANVGRNAVGDRVHVLTGDARALLPLLAPVDLITANIVSSTILELLPAMRDALAPGAHAILGGMLVSERAAVGERLAASGWRREADDLEDEWWATLIARS